MINNFMGADIMGMVLLVLLFFNSRQYQARLESVGIIRRIFVCIIVALAGDIFFYSISSQGVSGMLVGKYLSMYAFFIGIGAASYEWMCYTQCMVGQRPISGKQRIIAGIPFLLLTIATVTAPLNHWLYYFTEDGVYMRGSGIWFQMLVSYGYMMWTIMFSFIAAGKEFIGEQRRYYVNMGIYSAIPFIGGSIQVIFPGADFGLSSIAVAIIMLYLTNLGQDISVDALTGLNNRGRFEHYLEKRINDYTEGKDQLFLVFCDVDQFKRINDVYGHVEGDNALQSTAQVLKNVFNGTNAFLARYGGDEFAIIYTGQYEDICNYMGHVQAGLNEITKDCLYKIKLSFGYAHLGEADVKTKNGLIRLADQNMYQLKQNRHKKE